uniref:HMG box domain-containing protein n=1 Tax=viral metagenome TaxID=1070528 RepID=A0A6C0LZ77_9ZZZZ
MASKDIAAAVGEVFEAVLADIADSDDAAEIMKETMPKLLEAINEALAAHKQKTSERSAANKAKRDAGLGQPLNSFLLYSASVREDVAATLGDAPKQTDVAKAIGEMWKELGDDEKKPYEDEAKRLRADYNKRMAAAGFATSGKTSKSMASMDDAELAVEFLLRSEEAIKRSRETKAVVLYNISTHRYHGDGKKMRAKYEIDDELHLAHVSATKLAEIVEAIEANTVEPEKKPMVVVKSKAVVKRKAK